MGEEIREDLKYTETHEWLKVEGNKAKVGITDHAQSELTDIVFVELPALGKKIKRGEELCVVESVKSVSEIYSPVSGKILKVNNKLEDAPETVNQDPYDDGWLIEMEIADKKELDKLLDAESYRKCI